jgi:hypothetical protein
VNQKIASRLTKSELYEMLAAAVRNTQPQTKSQLGNAGTAPTTRRKRSVPTTQNKKQHSR